MEPSGVRRTALLIGTRDLRGSTIPNGKREKAKIENRRGNSWERKKWKLTMTFLLLPRV